MLKENVFLRHIESVALSPDLDSTSFNCNLLLLYAAEDSINDAVIYYSYNALNNNVKL